MYLFVLFGSEFLSKKKGYFKGSMTLPHKFDLVRITYTPI
jgi:hypothetical protein